MTRPALLSLLAPLLLACTPEHRQGESETSESSTSSSQSETTSGSASETTTGETSGSETTTGETTGETSDETTGEDNCEVPNEDGQGTARDITVVNIGDGPVFLVPEMNCSDTLVHSLSIDGETAEDAVEITCIEYAQGGCYGCDESDYGTPPIRLEPGGSFTWTFDGYIYQNQSFEGLDCSLPCWMGEDCPVGHVAPEGANLSLELGVASSCTADDPSLCTCEGGEVCALAGIVNFLEADFGPLTPRAIDFVLEPGDPVLVELSG